MSIEITNYEDYEQDLGNNTLTLENLISLRRAIQAGKATCTSELWLHLAYLPEDHPTP